MKVIINTGNLRDIQLLNDDGSKFDFPVRSFKLNLEADAIPTLDLSVELYNPNNPKPFVVELIDFDLAEEAGLRVKSHIQQGEKP